MPDQATLPTVLCIGGLDPSGGAGLFADARACAAFGTLALPVATAIVPQNTRGVQSIEAVAPAVIAAQIKTLLEDIAPAAVKIGMIPDVATVEVVAALLQSLRGAVPIVIDTVFAPTSGPIFSNEATIEAIRSQLLGMATVVTPNALEARVLGAHKIGDFRTMKRAAHTVLKRTGAQSVLLKGGHIDNAHALDLWCDEAGFFKLRAPRENAYEVRGTGCLLASALAATLAQGIAPREAARLAKRWLTLQIRRARIVGGGQRIAAPESQFRSTEVERLVRASP